jgi:hypothetical protein
MLNRSNTLSRLIRCKPDGNYFGRVRVNGKLIRRSLETHVLNVAKLKLSDFSEGHRRLVVNKGQSVNGEAIIEMFKKTTTTTSRAPSPASAKS